MLFLSHQLLGQELKPDLDIRIEIEKLIRFDTDISFKKTPGFIVTIIDDSDTYFIPFGNKQKKVIEPITENDVFEIGSVTKVFTAALMYQLITEFNLSAQATVNSFLDESWQNPRLMNLTIEDLIHHKSGFSRLPAFFGKKEKDLQSPYSNYTKLDLLKYFRDFIPEGEPKFEYSHTNYAILELIIEKIKGEPFNDAMQVGIFNPMMMENSFFDFKELSELSPGYDRSGKMAKPWQFASFAGSEGAKSTSIDLAHFVKNHCFTAYQNKLNSAGFNEMLGLDHGWHLIHMNHFNIYTHTGKTSGHNAFIAFIKETKTAVIILANSAVGTEDLGLQILRMINHNWKRVKV